MTFLRIIFIILLIYYLLRILLRLFAPKIISYAAKKTEAHFRNTFEGFSPNSSSNSEKVGDVFVTKKGAKKKTDSEKVGEYIDFEEID